MTAISLLTDGVGIKSPVCLPPGNCVTLRKPFNLLGCSVSICRLDTWLDGISKVLPHVGIPIQEQHHARNVGDNISLLPVSAKEVVEKGIWKICRKNF